MTKKRVKTPADSECYLAEIVGDESQLGQRMAAGKMLHMMDLAAASAAVKHAECPLVTLALDRIELLNFIFHMDYVRYDAYVIRVGKSSMVVKVDGYSKPPTEMEIQPAHSGVVTLVALDENGRPNANIPALEYRTSEDMEKKRFADEREHLVKKRKKEVEVVDNLNSIRKNQLKDYYSRNYTILPSETELKIRKMFLPRHANSMGVVFGGDTIEMMEELALATARQFTGNFRMVTIAMEDVLFIKPLKLDEVVEMAAVVTFVANSTLTVEVAVKAVNMFDPRKSFITNKGIFTILNYDRASRKLSITNGLNISKASLVIKKSYLKEQIKYENRTGKSER